MTFSKMCCAACMINLLFISIPAKSFCMFFLKRAPCFSFCLFLPYFLIFHFAWEYQKQDSRKCSAQKKIINLATEVTLREIITTCLFFKMFLPPDSIEFFQNMKCILSRQHIEFGKITFHFFLQSKLIMYFQQELWI